MIVRILGEGQLSVDDTARAGLNDLDAKLSDAIDRGDETRIPPCAESTDRRGARGRVTRSAG